MADSDVGAGELDGGAGSIVQDQVDLVLTGRAFDQHVELLQ